MAKVKERTWTTKNGETRTAWIADYRDQQGVRRLKTFQRKKDADAWLDQAKVEIRQGTHTAPVQAGPSQRLGACGLTSAWRAALREAPSINGNSTLSFTSSRSLAASSSPT
jgi:integrase